jgi:ADP-heptose:LPS heptosyltransferase
MSTRALQHGSVMGWRRRSRERLYAFLATVIGPFTLRAFERCDIQRLLILQLQQVGDSVVFTPALRAIRSRYPNAEIDLLCGPVSFEFYKKCPWIDHAFVDRSRDDGRRNWRSYFTTIRKLRGRRYDVVLADASETAALYSFTALLTGARQRLGFDADSRGFLFTTRLRSGQGIDFIDANLGLASSVDATALSRDVECFYDSTDEAYAEALFANVGGGRHVVALHPSSNWQSKTWYTERWAALADRLTAEYGASIVYVGTERERSAIEEIQRMSRSRSASFAGRTDLPQLAAVLAKCDLFIGTDSGPRHIAGGVGTPQVTLMSSQDVRSRWDFRRSSEVIIRTDPACSPCFQSFCSHRTCLAAITENMVFSACE